MLTSPRKSRLLSRLRILSGMLFIGGSTAVVLLAQGAGPAAKPAGDPAKSTAAFQRVATVLRHPRCMNCHTATEFPRQGNERRRHDMLVMRGPDDHGVAAMRCNSCHQATNQENGVPGAPNWGLAPLSMAWENLNDGQLADMLKDSSKNGQRSLEKLYDHMANDELVGWAWKPGAARETPPLSREEFAQAVREWIDAGAVSPAAK